VGSERDIAGDRTILDGQESTLTSAGSKPPPADLHRSGELAPTTLADRYHLIGLLGSGGMGTVYRARDTQLEEIVALKVLRKDLADTPRMIERFRREVKLARRVTHKNVARTFDIGEDRGDWFLTMEYIEGEPLSSLLRGGPLAPARSIAIARDLCDALAASHDAGVVHGDLKPENVICARSGRTVVTDFGIARAFSMDATDTRTAQIAGTPAYMAPEQVEGNVELDGRADIYALGCMLFRLFTGQLPWTGSSFIVVAAARLLRPPPDPLEIAKDLSPAIAKIIVKSLARDREDRWANANELARALDDAAPATSTSVRRAPIVDLSALAATKALAVLPLANEGPEADAYLAAGLGEELIDLLSAVPRLRVRPRGATGKIDPHADPREAGRALGVDAVIAGSVVRAGDAVRARLRLVTVADGFQLWAQRFERPAANVLALADEAAGEIAKVFVSEKIGDAREQPTDPMALDLYLRGRYVYARSFWDTPAAIAQLEAAHERAPRDPRIGATYALALLRAQAMGQVQNVAPQACSIAESILARGPNAEAHVVLAIKHLEEGETRSACVELAKALEIDPWSPDALDWKGRVLLEAGRPAEALAILRHAREVDPSLAIVDGSVARAYAFLGEWDAADEVCKRSDAEAGIRWTVRARTATWRRDRAFTDQLLEELARETGLSDAHRMRAARILTIASKGVVTELDEAALEAILPRSQVPRRKAFATQIRIELMICGGQPERARSFLPDLEECAFFDLTWLDRCPLLEPLRGAPELAAIRRQTEARAKRALEALDVKQTTASAPRR
jgi:serine/threonine-protein kinase